MRRTLVAFLALLLLSLQQEVLVHPLAHLVSRLAPAHDNGLAPTQAAETCAECALLAAGGIALGGEQSARHHEAPAIAHVARVVGMRVADAPAWFRSRAPPVLL